MILDATNEGLDLRAIQIEEIREVWNSLFTITCPSENQIRTWLCHDLYTIVLGLREASQAFCRSEGGMTLEHVIRYASKVMNSRSRVLSMIETKTETSRAGAGACCENYQLNQGVRTVGRSATLVSPAHCCKL
jgi:hypothetical protein